MSWKEYKEKYEKYKIKYINLQEKIGGVYTNIFLNDLKCQSGGILIVDYIDGEQVIILGRSNIPKRTNMYESFGGKTEKSDLTSLHTALRELVEEFFNVYIGVDDLNNLAYEFRLNNFIKDQYMMSGMAYLIDFSGLNFIFQNLCKFNKNFVEYNSQDGFDYIKYIDSRKVTSAPDHGLNEIEFLKLFKMSDVKAGKINLRWFTNKIINIMIP
jgi:hypothetical protein